jgi:predicted nucleic acid-binding Zn ribbon protein
MAGSNEFTLKQAIEALINNFKIEERLNETAIITEWERIVGKMVARHTSKIYIKNKVLFVELDSAALRNELGYAKTRLIAAVNAEVKANVITDIVFS